MRALRSALLGLAIVMASGPVSFARQPTPSKEDTQKMLLIAKDPPQHKVQDRRGDIHQLQLEARIAKLESRTRRLSRTTGFLFLVVCVLSYLLYRNSRRESPGAG